MKWDKTKPHAFIDGSFNPKTNTYGWGGILVENHNVHLIQGAGSEEEEISMRNIAGELHAARSAVDLAISLHLPEIQLLYDYIGIEKWATATWQRNTPKTKYYALLMQDKMNLIDISFIHVTAHTNIQGNEIADRLAKQSVGIL